jgi:hypothetical protein
MESSLPKLMNLNATEAGLRPHPDSVPASSVRVGVSRRILILRAVFLTVLTCVLLGLMIWVLLVADWPFLGSEHFYGDISCSAVRSVMIEYNLGHLAPGLADQVAAHLAECSDCAGLRPEVLRYASGYGPRTPESRVQIARLGCRCGRTEISGIRRRPSARL